MSVEFFCVGVVCATTLSEVFAGQTGLVVSASDCGVRIQVRISRRLSCLSRRLLRYATLGTGCAHLLHPSVVAESRTTFGWGKSGNVTSAGWWQATLCDLRWHVSSRSGKAGLHYRCKCSIAYTYFTLLLVMLALSRLVNASLMRQMQQLALPPFQFHCFKICCDSILYLDVNKSDSEVHSMLHSSVR